jgi:hypothetical protein
MAHNNRRQDSFSHSNDGHSDDGEHGGESDIIVMKKTYTIKIKKMKEAHRHEIETLETSVRLPLDLIFNPSSIGQPPRGSGPPLEAEVR